MYVASRRILVALAATLISFSVAAPNAHATSPIPNPAALQAALDAERDAGMIGLQAQVRYGSHKWRGASGLANRSTGQPVKPEYRHRIGSVTKTFVATALLQLVGEGQLDLDRPIGQYLPDVVPGEVGAQVSTRMLLNHTSGIGNHVEVLFATEEGIERYRTETITPRQIVATGLAMPRTNAPGERFSYSNTNYAIAGLLLERLTGRPAAFEISLRVLWPLGLWHSYFPGTDPRIFGPNARGYVEWSADDIRDYTEYNPSWSWMLGDLISTPDDLDTFWRALFTGRVLRPAELAQMTTTVDAPGLGPSGAGRYGLGLESFAMPCGQLWGHSGSVWGYQTFSYSFRDGSRRVTLAENMNEVFDPGIAQARFAFAVEAVCGPELAAQPQAGDSATRSGPAGLSPVDTLPARDR
jgi:D-alanyl-D-alanine carboxypeptidase